MRCGSRLPRGRSRSMCGFAAPARVGRIFIDRGRCPEATRTSLKGRAGSMATRDSSSVRRTIPSCSCDFVKLGLARPLITLPFGAFLLTTVSLIPVGRCLPYKCWQLGLIGNKVTSSRSEMRQAEWGEARAGGCCAIPPRQGEGTQAATDAQSATAPCTRPSRPAMCGLQPTAARRWQGRRRCRSIDRS